MKEINTGGPAFPRSFSADDADPDISYPAHTGMTLRDYFAAKAMLVGSSANKSPAYDDETRAKYAYELADAMLKAREV